MTTKCHLVTESDVALTMCDVINLRDVFINLVTSFCTLCWAGVCLFCRNELDQDTFLTELFLNSDLRVN